MREQGGKGTGRSGYEEVREQGVEIQVQLVRFWEKGAHVREVRGRGGEETRRQGNREGME